MLFPWKIENFDELQLPLSLISFAEIMHTFPSYECLQKGVRDFLIFLDLVLLINLVSASV